MTSNEQLLGCVGRMSQLARRYQTHHMSKQTKPTHEASRNKDNGGLENMSGIGLSVGRSVTPTVVVVSILPIDVFDLFLYTPALAINAAYSEHNKYLYFNMNQHVGKSKQRSLMTLLKDTAGTFHRGDFVFWMDEDVVVTDMNWRIENIITSTDEDVDVFFIQDELREDKNPYQQNITCILFRNTAWSLQFFFMFDKFLHFNEGDLAHKKNNYLSSFLATVPHTDFQKVKILPSSLFYATFPSHLSHQSTFPLLHLAGEDNVYARSVFEAGWTQVCGHTLRHNLHPNPAPHPHTTTITPTSTSTVADHDPLWSFINVDEKLHRLSTIDQFPFSLPPQLGLNPETLRQLHTAYQKKYLEIVNLVAEAKQLRTETGDTPIPFRSVSQIYRNMITFIEVRLFIMSFFICVQLFVHNIIIFVLVCFLLINFMPRVWLLYTEPSQQYYNQVQRRTYIPALVVLLKIQGCFSHSSDEY
jgi:hypothetical protein